MYIRSSKEIDIPEIIKIQAETGLSFWSVEDYKNEIYKVDSICKVAVKDEKIIGFALVKLLLGNEPKKFDSTEILNIAVCKKYQNSGIGQKIFDEILSEIKKLGVIEVWLEVRKSNNKALNFYQKNGFRQESIRKNYYQNPLEDAYILKLNINYES